MNTSTVMHFIKARWCMIAVLTVVSLITILLLLYVARLLFLPAEMTQSCGVVTYYPNNSTGI